jgi:hypothetical protein
MTNIKEEYSKWLEKKEEYHKWVEENDTYPQHSHNFVVNVYDNTDRLFRTFGTFETIEEAKEWFRNYYKNYTKPGFISRYKIHPLCEVL